MTISRNADREVIRNRILAETDNIIKESHPTGSIRDKVQQTPFRHRALPLLIMSSMDTSGHVDGAELSIVEKELCESATFKKKSKTDNSMTARLQHGSYWPMREQDE